MKSKIDKKKGNTYEENQNVDHLTKVIGVFGLFHAMVYTAIGLSIIIHGWQMFSNKFYTYNTDFWCKKPESLSDLSTKDWLHLSAPMKDVGNKTVYSQCEMFDVDYIISMKLKRPNENTASIQCKSWDYNTTYFDETITKRWNLVCGMLPGFDRVVQTVFFIGNFIGVFLIGPCSDFYGRKLAYMTALTIWSIVTIIGYLVDNPYVWVTTRFLAGGASQAYNIVGAIYIVELTSGSWRAKSQHWFHSLTWITGHLSLGLLVYLIPNMRNLELFIGLSALPFMVLWYLLPESPRWLLSKGRYDEAIEVIKVACKWNKMPMENIENFTFPKSKVQGRGSIKDLMAYPAIRRNSICIWFCWFACFMGYYGLIYNTPAFDWNIYLVFIFPAILGLPQALLMPLIENKLGRKPVLTLSLFMSGSLLLLTTLVPKGMPVIILAWTSTVSCTFAFLVLYTYTKELFPTVLRTTGLGTASAAAQLGSAASPIVAMLDQINPVLPLIIYGVIVLTAAIFSLWLWPETNKKQMTETLEEAEEVAKAENPWVKCCATP